MYNKKVLDNGVRVLTDKMDGVRSAAIGIWVGAGSRNESAEENGSAHFIEHMLFKGTTKHSAEDLACITDEVGGQVNAFTTRDSTCFYARVLDTHLERTGDMFADMFFDSLFAKNDIETERSVIVEEIDMYEDTPEDLVAEQMFAACFPGALGRPVLGTRETLATRTGDSLRDFMTRNYTAPRVLISLAGSFTDADAERIASRFATLSAQTAPVVDAGTYTPSFVLRDKVVEQNHVIIGYPGKHSSHADRFAMTLMSSIFGGGASSRLFQGVRERHGLCYSIYSFIANFAETGIFGISGAMSAATEQKALQLIKAEVDKLLQHGVTAEELHRANEQAKSSLLMSLESTSSRMNRMANGEMYRNSHMKIEDVIACYDAVTREDILRVARETFDEKRLSLSVLGKASSEEQYRGILT